ncbi:maternal effect protein staufen [Anopheles bellator]|uniref:maternal effect protein staufen n=1 Tax=Anopheles bellator TaxID=139047 RepID=UPI0026484448|nr:maternal effect protein staufen [Anopheles bellator]
MHGHMPPPQQHPGLHPAHQQPPPHLPHLSNLPPHSMQREHPANRLNNARHHHPRDHPAAMGPHLQMQVPPPPHRKPLPGPPPPTAGGYYTTNGPNIHGGLPKPLPMTAAHLHPPPALNVGLPPHQQHPGGPLPPPPGPHPGVVGKLPPPYGGGGQHGKPSMPHQQQHQPPVSVHHSVAMAPPVQPPIPVVSAATPAGTKTRHIPSTTDQKVHHHSHVTSQTNGTIGAPKGSGMYSEKSKPTAGGTAKATKDAHPSSAPTTTAPVTVSANAPCTAIVSIGPTPVSPPEASVAHPVVACASGSDTTVAEGATGPTVDSLSSANSTETLANMKEKTTMCMVNELARHNKILHQYRLTGETGPAHKKRFTVTLKLGDEEYTAEGASIKKAQHEAAGKAIAETKYKHPPARTNRRTKSGVKGNTSSFTPTVELNALAMKRGEPTVYKVMASPLPVSKYANGGGGFPPGGNGGRRALGPGPVDKLPPGGSGGIPGLLPYGGGSGLPPGGGRYGHPHGLDGGGSGGGGAVGPGGFWGRAPPGGAGGRGGMGGFHPGHQHQPPPHVHAHHHRGGLGDPHHHHHHPPHHHHSDTAAAGYGGHGPPAGSMNVHELYKATLRVGERTFLGEGQTPQAARHDAAARALEVLKPLTLSESTGEGRGKHTNADGTVGAGGDPGVNGDGGDPNAELKSPISLVHELAVQCQLPVEFEVISEKGPPHMTVFVTQCKVGTIVTEGEGTGKKQSKKRAAEKMLDELRKLKKTMDQESATASSSSHGVTAPWAERSQCERRNKKNAATAALSAPAADGSMVTAAKKKSRNLIKDKSVADVSEQENPISRLMQIQQARKEKQPVYTLVEGDRSSTGRRKQFTIGVSAAGKCAVGVGLTKKAAKWIAAEGLLSELGFAVTKTNPSAGAVNKENQSAAANAEAVTVGNGPRKVVFNESIVPSKLSNASDSRALVNGTAQHGKGGDASARDLMNDSTASNDSTATNSSGVSSASSGGAQATSATAAVQSSASGTPSKPDVGRNKEQLMYLAQLLKFEVQLSDFPKGNHGEYLTLVVLTTEPPQMCHGSGASLQESQDEAARCALEMLSKIGLDNVKPKPAAINSSSPAVAPTAGGPNDDGAIAATASK